MQTKASIDEGIRVHKRSVLPVRSSLEQGCDLKSDHHRRMTQARAEDYHGSSDHRQWKTCSVVCTIQDSIKRPVIALRKYFGSSFTILVVPIERSSLASLRCILSSIKILENSSTSLSERRPRTYVADHNKTSREISVRIL